MENWKNKKCGECTSRQASVSTAWTWILFVCSITKSATCANSVFLYFKPISEAIFGGLYSNKFNQQRSLDMYGCSVLLESIQEAVGHKKSEGENMIFNHVLFPTSWVLYHFLIAHNRTVHSQGFFICFMVINPIISPRIFKPNLFSKGIKLASAVLRSLIKHSKISQLYYNPCLNFLTNLIGYWVSLKLTSSRNDRVCIHDVSVTVLHIRFAAVKKIKHPYSHVCKKFFQ